MTGMTPLATPVRSISEQVERRHLGQTEAERAEAQALADAAGLLMAVPAATQAVLGVYRPCAPHFASLGRFSLYMHGAVGIALTREPHASSTYRRYGDPVRTLVSGLCEAELDGDSALIGLKALSLSALVDDILEAAKRDPDPMRRAHFAGELHNHIGRCFTAMVREMRLASQHEAALKAIRHADHHFALALQYADAMRKLNEQPVAAE